MQISKIELLPEEQILLATIEPFRIDLTEGHSERFLRLENCFNLTQSLIKRNAIPEIRQNYFIDAKYNLSNSHNSKAEIFESNGTLREDIFRHPQFLKYLKYFIYGADLPSEFKSQLKAIKDGLSFFSDFVEQATPNIKSYYNAYVEKANKKQFAEEIFKLCLDLEIDFEDSVQLRNKVMTFN